MSEADTLTRLPYETDDEYLSRVAFQLMELVSGYVVSPGCPSWDLHHYRDVPETTIRQIPNSKHEHEIIIYPTKPGDMLHVHLTHLLATLVQRCDWKPTVFFSGNCPVYRTTTLLVRFAYCGCLFRLAFQNGCRPQDVPATALPRRAIDLTEE